MSHPPARRPVLARLAALAAVATAVAYGAGDLAARLHAAGTRHVVCPEHGELVHAGGAAGHHHEAALEEGSAPGFSATAGPDEHGHHHCALAGHLGHSGLQAGAVERLAPPTAPRQLASAGADRPHAAVATLRLAPKHSPPAVHG